MMRFVLSALTALGLIAGPKSVQAEDGFASFGRKATWLAISTTDTQSVATALGLTETSEVEWSAGVADVYARRAENWAFVAPPVQGWTLVFTGLSVAADSDAGVARVTALLRDLSKTYGQAQYFGSYRVVDYVAWARAENGTLSRAFSWADGQMYWTQGPLDPAEEALGYFETQGLTTDQVWEQLFALEEKDVYLFDEDDPSGIAQVWSVNPLTIEADDVAENATGLLGRF